MELSFGKLLVLAIVILVVWYGFKYAARVEAVRRSLKEELTSRHRGAGSRTPARPVEDLVKCPRCSAFVAASGAANCGKQGCPWAR